MENVTDRGATFAGPDERSKPLPVFSKGADAASHSQRHRKLSTLSNLGNKSSYIYSFSKAHVTV